jgi:hypothetical protein
MLQVIALMILAILVVVANPIADTEMYDTLPITPAEKSKGSCRLVIDQSMKRIRDHCAQEDIPHVMDIPTSSPLLPYPRIMDPTHPPKVQNPIGRPAYHPTTKPHPVYNQTSTKPPAQYNPIGTTRPPAMIATAQPPIMVTDMPAVYNPIGTTRPPAMIATAQPPTMVTDMPAVYNPIGTTQPPTMAAGSNPAVSFQNM